MRRFTLFIGLLAVAGAVPGSSGAQTPASRWSLSLVQGTTSAGPATSIEKAMIDAGFDDGTPACWSGCNTTNPHPKSRTGWSTIGFPWMAEVKYRHTNRLGATLAVGKSAIGTTAGFRDREIGLGDFLTVHYAVQHATAAGVLSLGPLHVKAGPAVYRSISWQEMVDSKQVDRRVKTSFGLNYGAGVTVPIWRRLSAEARYDYRSTGSAQIGPFESGEHTVAATPGNFSHWFAGAGFSVRF